MRCPRCQSPNAIFKGECLLCGHSLHPNDPMDGYYETSADIPRSTSGKASLRRPSVLDPRSSMEDTIIDRLDTEAAINNGLPRARRGQLVSG